MSSSMQRTAYQIDLLRRHRHLNRMEEGPQYTCKPQENARPSSAAERPGTMEGLNDSNPRPQGQV